MNRGIYPILSGALAQEERIQVFSNNIANVNTTGFKQDEPMFQSILSNRVRAMVPAMPAGFVSMTAGSFQGPSERVYVKQHGLNTTFDAGRLRKTDNPLDLAIQGEGYFEVQAPEGIRYTRNGIFQLDAKRRLVNGEGHPVMGIKGEIKLPPGTISVDGRGAISVNGQPAGTIKVMEFKERGTLRKAQGGLFAGDKGTVMKDPTILGGHIEESNVNPLGEMVKLIQGMRTYESAQKMIQTFDRMMEMAVQDVGRVA